MKYKIFLLTLIIIFLPFRIIEAQDAPTDDELSNVSENENPANGQKADQGNVIETFKARVTEIIDTGKLTAPGEINNNKLQKLKLIGISGKYNGKEFIVENAPSEGDFANTQYSVGDKVLIMYSYDDKGNGIYTITDYVRTNVILWLFIALVLSVILVGRFKGLRSIISLVVTFFIIIKYIVPQILNGADPVRITVIGSIAILISIIYISEGWNMKSNIAALSILLSLVITIILSWYMVNLARLSGLSSEEAGFTVTLGNNILNLKGILLAGIIIGTLGALDDIVISQVATVSEITSANPDQTRAQILKKSYSVGISHISAMTNTLFLAYSGAALPLLILFISGQSAFGSWDVAINNEMLATEIIRTLAGTIGIVLSVPISTLIAVWWFKRKKYSTEA